MTLSTKVLSAAKAERTKHGAPGAQNGDKAFTGSVRKQVLTAALLALSPSELAKLAKQSAQALHQWLAGVLHHAGCLRLPPKEYLANVQAAVDAKLQAWADAQPSMPGPAHITRAALKLAAMQAAEKESSKPAKIAKAAPKPAKASDAQPRPAKKPPKRPLADTLVPA